MNQRVHNFNAGPACLPEEVLKQCSDEMLNWNNTGMSLFEVSHRSKEFIALMEKTKKNLTTLLEIPSNFKILFMQGGASLQFSAVPMNLLQESTADYIVTGTWSKKAFSEAKKYGSVNKITDSSDTAFTKLQDSKDWKTSKEASYVYYCDNETVHGFEFHEAPKVQNNAPLIADMSSNLLSKKIDFSKYGLIYACAQKNFGAAGLVVVIIREDLIGKESKITPSMMSYKVMDDNDSSYNTPPTYSIYVANLIFEWLLKNGGIESIEKKNKEKSNLLYDFIDNSSFYFNPVDKKNRSTMNIICKINGENGEKLEKELVSEAKKQNIIGIAGHRSVGGLRFSCYNALELKSVEVLLSLLKEFEKNHK
eukprot:gene6685-10850_t